MKTKTNQEIAQEIAKALRKFLWNSDVGGAGMTGVIKEVLDKEILECPSNS